MNMILTSQQGECHPPLQILAEGPSKNQLILSIAEIFSRETFMDVHIQVDEARSI
jgi:hypothetical protein